jgi:hypothetical protein
MTVARWISRTMSVAAACGLLTACSGAPGSNATPQSGTPAPGCFKDIGDGTIHDTCTGLQWEKKTNTAGLHDASTHYVVAGCCGGFPSCPTQCQPNAAAATTCLAHSGGGADLCSTCSSGPCDVADLGVTTTVWDWINQVNAENFAGHSDWRLPSESGCNACWSGSSGPGAYACSACDAHELETILLAPFPCPTNPCIDPIFGPSGPDPALTYWSASASMAQTNFPHFVWWADLSDGSMQQSEVRLIAHARAVRTDESAATGGDSSRPICLVGCIPKCLLPFPSPWSSPTCHACWQHCRSTSWF